jgi:leucyl aminopeptidase (aminopeptidase T)
MNQRRLAERVAYKLIYRACRLHVGDFALLSGRRDQLDLLLLLEFQALAAGARAVIAIEDEERLRHLLSELPPAAAANERLSLLPAAQTLTHVLRLDVGSPDLRGVPPESLRAWQEADQTLQAALAPHLRGWIDVALPSRRQAQRLRQPFHPYHEAIWQALDSDYALMEERERRLQAALAGAPLVRLSDPRGAELTLRLAAESPRRCNDGSLDPEDQPEAGGSARRLLPAGEFCAAVAPGSAEGEVITDTAWLGGKAFRHLRLRFRQGRVVGIEGTNRLGAEAVLAANHGASLLGKLSIGFNPAVTTLRPYPLGSEAALLAFRRAGAVFLTLGDQRASGGAGSLGLARAMLEVDGQALLRGGEFIAH